MIPSLSKLRWSLTLWYAATLSIILVLLGGGLFFAIRSQYGRTTRRTLRAVTADVVRQMQTRGATPKGTLGSAALQPYDPGAARRSTFVLTPEGRSLLPAQPDAWVRDAAVRAARVGRVDEERDGPRETTLRLHAERFGLPDGTPLVAAAVDTTIELEDRYAELIATFAAASLAALVLVAVGGWILVCRASRPIEGTIDHMRRFMADAAHELRTPVTIVRTRAEVALQQPREGADYVATLRGIESEARHLGGVVDSLFTLARAEAGEHPAVLARVYLDDIVLEAAEAAAVVARAKGVGVSVEEYEEAEVDGDTTLLRQLTMNLLDNAIKFTLPGGRVIVRVSGGNGRPLLTIEDTGIGIAAAHLPHIFDRFYRGDEARQRSQETGTDGRGAGLGLAIARWIAEVHKAEISATSVMGKGTRLAVRFPPPSTLRTDTARERASAWSRVRPERDAV